MMLVLFVGAGRRESVKVRKEENGKPGPQRRRARRGKLRK